MRTLRQQFGEWPDMGYEFQQAVYAVWLENGIDAARCFALGA